MQKRFETADRHSVTNKIHEGKNLKNLVNVYKFRCWVWLGLVGFFCLFLRQAKYISSEASLITSQEQRDQLLHLAVTSLCSFL